LAKLRAGGESSTNPLKIMKSAAWAMVVFVVRDGLVPQILSRLKLLPSMVLFALGEAAVEKGVAIIRP
jgi:hypothetical protein